MMWWIVHVMRPIYVAVVASILPNPNVESVIVSGSLGRIHFSSNVILLLMSYRFGCMYASALPFFSQTILIIRSIYTLIILVAIHSDEKDHLSS